MLTCYVVTQVTYVINYNIFVTLISLNPEAQFVKFGRQYAHLVSNPELDLKRLKFVW